MTSFARDHPDSDRRAVGAAPRCWRRRSGAGRAHADRRVGPDRFGGRRDRVRASCGIPTRTSFGVVRADNFALFINLILCMIGILTMIFSADVVERENLPAGEYYALTLFAIAGMMLMAAATDLLVIFLALEILSLAVYVLTGAPARAARPARRPAFKYFLLGAFSSAFFLYGIAFAFAIAGSTRLDQIGTRDRLRSEPRRCRCSPWGCWSSASRSRSRPCRSTCGRRTPTRARRRSSPAFMSTGVKAAAFAAFVRVFLSALEPLQAHWMPVLSVIAGAHDDRGHDRRACAQSNVKRMLAYSSIAHAGYLLVGTRRRERRQGRPRSCSTCWRTRSRTSARSVSSRSLGTADHAARRAARLRRPLEDAAWTGRAA